VRVIIFEEEARLDGHDGDQGGCGDIYAYDCSELCLHGET
jgi:hypothetical protein